VFRQEGGSQRRETVWALKDVNLEVQPGKTVGIIGANGAGKSTLLKIFSRITPPTTGRVLLRGRVASLLEVGTGFHPELTGRENVHLNGTILGMTRQEVQRKFDEIVAFAEVERFIDTPVKRYSSGMYLRLAFAVAAHLEPEILLVDEVLAVGDAAFQKKCLGVMGSVARDGRTVLFVSHTMASIQALCEEAILIECGRVARSGAAREVVSHYLASVTAANCVPLEERHDRSGDGSVRLQSLEIASADPDGVIRPTSRLKVTVGYRSEKCFRRPNLWIAVYDTNDTGIYLLNSDSAPSLPDTWPAQGTASCYTEPINLTPGRCYMNIALIQGGDMADYIQRAAYFDVEQDCVDGTNTVPPRHWVLCLLGHRWCVEEAQA
jgi:lipopolysaccharide transport system ATP-binding protein